MAAATRPCAYGSVPSSSTAVSTKRCSGDYGGNVVAVLGEDLSRG
ncbi:hypothetical protein [Mesorhizobium sp. M0522]